MEPVKNLTPPLEPAEPAEPAARLFGSTLAAGERTLPAGLFWAGLLLFGSAAVGLLTAFLAPDYAGRGFTRVATHLFVLFDVVAGIMLVRRDERLVIPVIVRAVAGILLHVAFGVRHEHANWLVFNSAFHVAVVLLLVGDPGRARVVAGMLLGVVPLGFQLQAVTASFHRTLVQAAAPAPAVETLGPVTPARRPVGSFRLAEHRVTLPRGWHELEKPVVPGATSEYVAPASGARVLVYRWPEPYADALEFGIVLGKIVQDLPYAVVPNGSTWDVADGPFLVRRFARARGEKTIRNVPSTIELHARAERATRFAIVGIAPVSQFQKAGVLAVMESFEATGVPDLASSRALPAAVDPSSTSIVQIDGAKELETGVIVAQRGDELDAVCVRKWVRDDVDVKVGYAGPAGAFTRADGKVIASDAGTNLALVRFRGAGTRTVARLAGKVALTGPTDVHLVGFPAAGGDLHAVAPVRRAGPWGGETPANGRFDLLDAPHDRRLSGSAIVANGEVLGIAVIDLDEPEGHHGIDAETIRAFLKQHGR